MTSQVCSHCDEEKPIGEYHRNKQSPTGYRRECKACLKHRIEMSLGPAPGDDNTKGLRPEDLVACGACGLRGHQPGDPDRCIGGSELMHRRGLGSMWWT